MSHSRSCKEEHAKQREWSIPRMIGMRKGCKGGHDHSGIRQRLLGDGAEHEQARYRQGDGELHDVDGAVDKGVRCKNWSECSVGKAEDMQALHPLGSER